MSHEQALTNDVPDVATEPELSGAEPRDELPARPQVSFLGGTTHSRGSVGLRGEQRDVADRDAEDKPAGCPCSSGF